MAKHLSPEEFKNEIRFIRRKIDFLEKSLIRFHKKYNEHFPKESQEVKSDFDHLYEPVLKDLITHTEELILEYVKDCNVFEEAFRHTHWDEAEKFLK